MAFFRECDAFYLETGNHTHADSSIALEDVEATFRKYLGANATVLTESCKNGSMFMVKKAIEKGATDWNWGLRGACGGGHRELAELMIEKGATNWGWGLRGACGGGHQELAELMIEKGATDWNWGLECAC